MTMTDERLAELDAVMAKARAFPFGAVEWEVAFTVARLAAYNAIPDLRAHIDAQAATIARAIAIIEHCDVTEGVCCCGDEMDTHAEPMSCGHSPVDHGRYIASQWLDEARATLTKIGANQ